MIIIQKNLPPERQGEMAHRYVCGLYHCMRELTKRFPDILFEGCSAGGNRFDLGILCYFPQIWQAITQMHFVVHRFSIITVMAIR